MITTLTVILALIILVWTSRHLQISAEGTGGEVLTPNYKSVLNDPPLVTVIVSAKDEETCIEKCVRSVLSQDYPNFEIIACNDRSDDRTGEILDSLAAEDNRLSIIHIDHLPNGWFGKPHAMQHAIKTAHGKWICMIDADCWQTSEHSLYAAMKFAMDQKADLLSALPQMQLKSFWENVIQPVCSAIMMIWFTPSKVNNPTKKNAYANGAFILMKKDVYYEIGTFKAICNRVTEDMHLAKLVKKSNYKLKVVRTDGLYKVRMYTNLKDILNGWTRIFFGSFGSFKKIFASLLFLFIFSILPYITLLLGLFDSVTWLNSLTVISSITIAMQISVIYRYTKLLGGIPILSITYILGCIMAFGTLVIAMTKLKKGAKLTWKNTTYDFANSAE